MFRNVNLFELLIIFMDVHGDLFNFFVIFIENYVYNLGNLCSFDQQKRSHYNNRLLSARNYDDIR